jgi:hypothetical protein
MSWLPKLLVLVYELASEALRERARINASRKVKETAEARAREHQAKQEAEAVSHKVTPIR